MGGGAQKPLLFRSFPYERFPEVDSLHQGCTNLHSVGEGIIAEIHKVIPILIAVNPFGIIDPLDTVIKGMDLFSRKKKTTHKLFIFTSKHTISRVSQTL